MMSLGKIISNKYLQPSKKKVDKEKAREIRDKVAPVIEWLKTAEEETDEEEDDDDSKTWILMHVIFLFLCRC